MQAGEFTNTLDVHLEIEESAKIQTPLDLKEIFETCNTNETKANFVDPVLIKKKLSNYSTKRLDGENSPEILYHNQELEQEYPHAASGVDGQKIYMFDLNIPSKIGSIPNPNTGTKDYRDGFILSKNILERKNRNSEILNTDYNQRPVEEKDMHLERIRKVKIRNAECLNIFALALLLNVIRDVQHFWEDDYQNENFLYQSMVKELLFLVHSSIAQTNGTPGLKITPGGNLIETGTLCQAKLSENNRFYQYQEAKRIIQLLKIINSKSSVSVEALVDTYKQYISGQEDNFS